MVRRHGRCARGKRLAAKVPHGHWKTLTFIAALRIDGLTAPYVIDGAMDGPAFLAYVEQVLAPSLQKGGIAFMDNPRTHKVDGVAAAIAAAGATVRYLPAYSPDLNPIEMAFAKLKEAMRKGAQGLDSMVAAENQQTHPCAPSPQTRLTGSRSGTSSESGTHQQECKSMYLPCYTDLMFARRQLTNGSPDRGAWPWRHLA